MAGNTTGQFGTNAGFSSSGVQQARNLNQQAMKRAGQAGQAAGFEFGSELGATGATGAAGANSVTSGVAQARQRNQQAMQNASAKAGRTSR